MKDEKIFELINKYYDNETSSEEENYLFSMLANDDEAKKYFKGFLFLKNEKNNLDIEPTLELDEKVFNKITDKKHSSIFVSSFNSKAAYITTTLSIVLLFLVLLFYNEKESYKEEFINASRSNFKQERIIEALYRSLPSAVVESTRDSEVIVSPL